MSEAALVAAPQAALNTPDRTPRNPVAPGARRATARNPLPLNDVEHSGDGQGAVRSRDGPCAGASGGWIGSIEMDCGHYARSVQALVDDDLAPVERLLLEDHEQRCYACIERRTTIERLFAALNALPREATPDGFEDAVLRRLLATPGRRHLASDTPRPAHHPEAQPAFPEAAPAAAQKARSSTHGAEVPGRPLLALVVLGSLAAALLGILDAPGMEAVRAGLGRFACGWYGWAQDVAAGLTWCRDVSWAELVLLGEALQGGLRGLLAAPEGWWMSVVFASGSLFLCLWAATTQPLRIRWSVSGLLAACAVVLGVFAAPQRGFAADVKSERPREEMLRLEARVEARQNTLDSLLQRIETVPEARLEKAILEQVHELTDALREDRRRLQQLRDAVVPVDPESAPRAARPPRPPRAPGASDSKIIARNLVRIGEDVEVRTGETVNGDAIIVDGDLWVDGRVEGDAVVLGGNLHLGRRASISGQAIAIAGRVDQTPGADVAGQVLSLTLMPGNFLAGTWPQWVSLVVDLLKLGFLLLVAGLFLAVVPDRMARARAQLGESFLKCFGVGLVVLFGGSFAVAVSVMLLSITFIGIPAALLVTFASGVLLIASLFVGVLLVGDRLQALLNLGRRAPWVSIGLGLLFIMLPELLADLFRVAIPFGTGFGFNIFSKGLVLVTVAAGLGAIVLSRLGASESGQAPQPSV